MAESQHIHIVSRHSLPRTDIIYQPMRNVAIVWEVVLYSLTKAIQEQDPLCGMGAAQPVQISLVGCAKRHARSLARARHHHHWYYIGAGSSRAVNFELVRELLRTYMPPSVAHERVCHRREHIYVDIYIWESARGGIQRCSAISPARFIYMQHVYTFTYYIYTCVFIVYKYISMYLCGWMYRLKEIKESNCGNGLRHLLVQRLEFLFIRESKVKWTISSKLFIYLFIFASIYVNDFFQVLSHEAQNRFILFLMKRIIYFYIIVELFMCICIRQCLEKISRVVNFYIC